MEASSIRIQGPLGFRCCARNLRRSQFKNQPMFGSFSRQRTRISMHLEESSVRTPGFKANSTIRYSEDKPDQFVEGPEKSHPTAEFVDGKIGIDEPIHEGMVPIQQKRAAKIHDFCFGIPFGGLVLGGGFVGFILSQNLSTLSAGLLFGGALLALSFFSLKVWRHGLSSLPFTLGQGAIAAVLFWKQFQIYSVTKKIFPTGFYAVLSAAMFCFYSYVLISGGNPPPKKKSVATSAS